jgi:hypothetical protein
MRKSKLNDEVVLFHCFEEIPISLNDRIKVSTDKLVPSPESIGVVIGELKSSKDKIAFIECHNNYMRGSRFSIFPEQYDSSELTDLKQKSIFELERKIFNNREEQCKAVDCGEGTEINFDDYWQSITVIKWFHYMVSNSRSYRTQTLGRGFSKILRSEKDGAYFDKSEIDWSKDYSNLEKYPEYTRAIAIFDGVNYAINFAEKSNPRITGLKTHQLEIHIELARELEGTKGMDRPFTCPICKGFFLIAEGERDRKYCESNKCEKEYFRKYRAEKRASNPKKSNVRVQSARKRGKCNRCGETRVLTNGYCDLYNHKLDECWSQDYCKKCKKKNKVILVDGEKLCKQCIISKQLWARL